MSEVAQPAVPGPLYLWTLLLAGPVAWAVRLVVSYMGIALACAEGLVGPQVAGFPLLSYVMLGIGLVFVLICLAATVLSWLAWRRSRVQARVAASEQVNWTSALAAIGIFLNAFFFVTTAAETAAIFFFHPCE